MRNIDKEQMEDPAASEKIIAENVTSDRGGWAKLPKITPSVLVKNLPNIDSEAIWNSLPSIDVSVITNKLSSVDISIIASRIPKVDVNVLTEKLPNLDPKLVSAQVSALHEVIGNRLANIDTSTITNSLPTLTSLSKLNPLSAENSVLLVAQEQEEQAAAKLNDLLEEFGQKAGRLYEKINALQQRFDLIRNVSSEKQEQYQQSKKICSNWKQATEKIESTYNLALASAAGMGVAGVGAGIGVVALAPSAAMGVATTFGVASTGTAISTLHGVAATNAALAWLGGGALSAGGGGTAAGSALLALSGPLGWAVAGIAFLGSGYWLWSSYSEKTAIEATLSAVLENRVKKYELSALEIHERIKHIEQEDLLLAEGLEKIVSFGLDYSQMSEAQQYELGACVNLMTAATQLLINPIQGMQPKYGENDWEDYLKTQSGEAYNYCTENRNALIALADFFYNVELDERKQKAMLDYFQKHENFLISSGITREGITKELLEKAIQCLEYKYGAENSE